jgi:hypothetical protein
VRCCLARTSKSSWNQAAPGAARACGRARLRETLSSRSWPTLQSFARRHPEAAALRRDPRRGSTRVLRREDRLIACLARAGVHARDTRERAAHQAPVLLRRPSVAPRGRPRGHGARRRIEGVARQGRGERSVHPGRARGHQPPERRAHRVRPEDAGEAVGVSAGPRGRIQASAGARHLSGESGGPAAGTPRKATSPTPSARSRSRPRCRRRSHHPAPRRWSCPS